ncbi:MAG TPA: cysteine-rich CWC family protein [Burkholderiales bacterium]
MKELACARCGRVFRCGADEEHCWCVELPPLEPVPGRGCLCPECLELELKERSAPDPRP